MAPPQMTSADTQLLTVIVDQLDKIGDRINHIEVRLEGEKREASESRRRMYEKQESHSELLITISHKVQTLEKAVESATPTLKEYAETKAKVSGAGLLGVTLWKVGAWLIGTAVVIYGVRHDIVSWWHWFMTKP